MNKINIKKILRLKDKNEIIKGEKVYDIGDIVLYNRKKYKITHNNWKIDEYRIIEIENPNNYHWVVGKELKEVNKNEFMDTFSR